MNERAKGCPTIGEVIELAGRVYPKAMIGRQRGYRAPEEIEYEEDIEMEDDQEDIEF